MLMSDHHTNPDFANVLRAVYAQLQQQCLQSVSQAEVLVQHGDLKFIGLWSGLEANFSSNGLRRMIGSLTKQEHGFRMVQIVGDCTCQFSVSGITQAKGIIEPLVSEGTALGKHTVLEYGYTASQHDVNWIVNDVITSVPGLGARSVANIVYMSAAAIETGDYEATSRVSNFVLAYDHEGETAFGSDIWLSDSVMSAEYEDKLICIEGGPQAFAQAVDVCVRGVTVVAVTGAGMRVSPSRAPKVHFSAAYALSLLHTCWMNCTNKPHISHEDKIMIEAAVMSYIDGLDDFRSSNNPQRLELVRSSLEAIIAKVNCLEHLEVICT